MRSSSALLCCAGYFVLSWWLRLGLEFLSPHYVYSAMQLTLWFVTTEPARNGTVEFLQARLASANTTARGSQ